MQTSRSLHTENPAANTRNQRTRRPVIVLLEDDEALRFVSAEVLRAAGYDVRECPDLLTAFVALKSAVPDIMLIDREVPDGSGFDLARWVRRQSAFDRVRVVGFSGRKNARDVEAAFAAGCDAFVGKPCAPADLVAEIRRAHALR
jgi:DNA-binding response OmpR family regulator